MAGQPTENLFPDPLARKAVATASDQQVPTGGNPPSGSAAGPYLGETLEPPAGDTDSPAEVLEMSATLDAPSYTAAAPTILRRHFGDYELLEEIARGGMGVVFKARQKSLNRIVAVKMILAGHLASPEQVRRFRLEAEEAALLDHPNIVPIYQVAETDGQHYFTMKLIKGGSLAQRLKKTPLPPHDAVRLLAKVARAVHYAHQHGILHRDLKPGNILLDRAGEPHVTDFGLAKHLAGPGAPAADNASTQSGAVVGTPAYMAPEQAAARKDLSVAVDVYSLGAVLFELLTGRPPFQAANAIDTLIQVMEKDPPRPRSFNPRLDHDLEVITLKCLEKEPVRRYGSASRLAEDLDRYLMGEPIQARPTTRVERTIKWVRRRPAVAALVGVICLAGLLFLTFGWWTSLRLQSALNRAEQEREEANRQRDRVKANVQKRLDGIDDFLVHIDERLQHQNVPGSVRLEFLNDVLELSQDVLKEDPTNRNARRQVGKLYFRIGDLYRQSRLFPAAEKHFSSALTMQRQFAQDDPDYLDGRHDLAITSARYARLLQQLHRFDDALKSADEAVRLEDELTATDPEQPRYPEYAAYYRYRRADLLEAAGRIPEAEKGYQGALRQQEQLVAAQSRNPTHHIDLASTADALAALLTATDPPAAIPYRQRVVQARRQLMALGRNDRQYAGALMQSYADVGALLRQCGKHEELMKLSEALRADLPDDPNGTYDAACFAANAAQAAQDRKDLPEAERRQLANHYAEQAIKLLDMAIHEGYRNHLHMAKDADLDPLRSRKDYQDLVAGLEQRYPAPPSTPAQELAALQGEYNNDLSNYNTMAQAAETVAEKKRAEAKKPHFEQFAERALVFAQKNRESAAAVDALVWVLENTVPAKDQPLSDQTVALRQKALTLLEQDHFKKPELASVCRRLSESPAPDCDKLLRAAIEKHAHRDVQGLAGYALALSFARQAEIAQQTGSAGAADLLHAAEEQLEKVAKDYADVPCGRSQLGEVARAKLVVLRHLSIGRPALNITGADLNGKPMALTELGGKVVVLFFWADWCGYCRQMYAQARSLVDRHQEEPFVLVGINCDDDKDNARRAIQKSRLNWRNWWDGDKSGSDRITAAWQVDGFPTVYVLDRKGVIRYKEVRGQQLEAAVEELLTEN